MHYQPIAKFIPNNQNLDGINKKRGDLRSRGSSPVFCLYYLSSSLLDIISQSSLCIERMVLIWIQLSQ